MQGQVRSKALQANLDITDRLRDVISGINGDYAFKAKLEDNIPQIVVIGDQSA